MTNYEFYYKTYPFETATRLCIMDAQKILSSDLDQIIERHEAFYTMKHFGMLPISLNMLRTTYDIISEQIHKVLSQAGNEMKFKPNECLPNVILDDFCMSEKAKQDFADKEDLDDIKDKLCNVIGSPYGISIQCGMEILRADTKDEINKILNKYNHGK